MQPSSYTDGTTHTTSVLIAAEALGQTWSNGTGVGKLTRAVEVAIDHPQVAGYAFYDNTTEGSTWRWKLLLINLLTYLRNQGNTTRGAPRGKVHIDLSFSVTNSSFVLASPIPQAMAIKRLAIPYADDTSGITWGGQTYETSNGIVSRKSKIEKNVVATGVDLWDTEAILIYFD